MLLAFWPLVVHLLAYHVERGCRTRVRRRAFGGIFLIVSLKRVADAVPNRPLKGSKKNGEQRWGSDSGRAVGSIARNRPSARELEFPDAF